MSWKIKKFDELTVRELHEIYLVRTEVFVVEQNCPYQEVDGLDFDSQHLFYEEEGKILAYLRIIPAGLCFEEVDFGRVLVKKSARGRGFYKSFGFEDASEEFLEDDIPHLEMFRKVN